MINIFLTICMVFIFLISGNLIEAVKRILMLITNIIFKILNFFGLKISNKDFFIKIPKNFKRMHGDIKEVKKSKENLKLKPSINVTALCTTITCACLILCNIIWKNCIVDLIWEWNWLHSILKNKDNLEIVFTAIMFSSLSFAISKLISQWNETKYYREAKKQIKQRRQLLYSMSSKELLDVLKEKDTEAYENLKAGGRK